MTRSFTGAVLPAAFLLAAVCLQSVQAQDEESSLYGRMRTILTAGMFDSLGFSTETLLKGDWKPSENVRFHVEGEFSGAWGSVNEFSRAAAEGLPSPAQELFPFKDFHTKADLSQAWTSLALGPVDLTVGRQPLAWGTGYLFNPTSVLYPPSFPGEDLEEVPSTVAISSSVDLTAGFALSGYLAFEDRFRSTRSVLSEGAYDRLPFGVKISSRTDLLDASVSFFREVQSSALPATVDRIGADAVGTLFDAGWYVEAALVIPKKADGAYNPESLVFSDDFSVSLGGDWTVPGIEVTVRAEYAHLGNGERDKSLYRWMELLSGSRALLAEDYLFMMLERSFLSDWKLTAAGLVNLNEGGAALLGGLTWAPGLAIELELGGTYYAGPEGGELDGRIPLPGMSSVDTTRPELHLGLTVFF